MISAFGVEHTIEKSLKPRHVAAMQRAADTPMVGSFRDFRQSLYAEDRLRLHGLQQYGKDIAPRMTTARKYTKGSLKRLSRTRRSTRDKNRKPIFGDQVKQ